MKPNLITMLVNFILPSYIINDITLEVFFNDSKKPSLKIKYIIPLCMLKYFNNDNKKIISYTKQYLLDQVAIFMKNDEFSTYCYDSYCIENIPFYIKYSYSLKEEQNDIL